MKASTQVQISFARNRRLKDCFYIMKRGFFPLISRPSRFRDRIQLRPVGVKIKCRPLHPRTATSFATTLNASLYEGVFPLLTNDFCEPFFSSGTYHKKIIT